MESNNKDTTDIIFYSTGLSVGKWRGIIARKFRTMNQWLPPLHWRHILSSRYDCKSSLLSPFLRFWPSLRSFQHDSISWVWTPVLGSTKWRASTTTRWAETLGNLASLAYAPQSSLCTSVLGRTHRRIIGKRVAAFRLRTTWKNPLAGVNWVDTMPNTQASRALLPWLNCKNMYVHKRKLGSIF